MSNESEWLRKAGEANVHGSGITCAKQRSANTKHRLFLLNLFTSITKHMHVVKLITLSKSQLK